MWNRSTTNNGWLKKLQHSMEGCIIGRCMTAYEEEFKGNGSKSVGFVDYISKERRWSLLRFVVVFYFSYASDYNMVGLIILSVLNSIRG